MDGSVGPAAEIVARARETRHVVDALGRTLAMRRLTALDRLRLFKAVGPVLSQNESYLGMAVLASMVTDIDGVPVPSPASEAQVEAAVGRLGEAGLAAVDAAFEAVGETSTTETDAGN